MKFTQGKQQAPEIGKENLCLTVGDEKVVDEGVTGEIKNGAGGQKPSKKTSGAKKVLKKCKETLIMLFYWNRSIDTEEENEAEKSASTLIQKYSNYDTYQVLCEVGSRGTGLNENEVKNRLLRDGMNSLPTVKPKPWYTLLIIAILHPFNILLMTMGIISVAVPGNGPTTIIFTAVMVFLSTCIRFSQEMQSQHTFNSMRNLMCPTTRVIREVQGKSVEITIPTLEVVAGDILHLRAGDILPADVRLLESKNLSISQSSLTGEFLPVEKNAGESNESTPALERPNVCFMATSVVSGTGSAVVFATGKSSYISTIYNMLDSKAVNSSSNSFDVGVKKVAYLLLGFGCVLVPIVIVLNGFTSHDFQGAAFFGISVLVGLTPEMLPMILNANLAKAAMDMAKCKIIVRKAEAIQTMGAVNVLCSDKTGTLTVDEIVLVDTLDSNMKSNNSVLRNGYYNSHFSTGFRNSMDNAIFQKASELKLDADQHQYSLIEEIPFDFINRRVSVILKGPDEKFKIICKGAVEEVLDICSQRRNFLSDTDKEDVDLTSEDKERLLLDCKALNSEGYRVLAVASRSLDSSITHNNGFGTEDVEKDKDMTFIGFLTFLDPPKPDCAEAISEFAQYNVDVKVLTGDNLEVSTKICKDVGISVLHTTTGPELAALSPEDFEESVIRCTLFAKLTPLQKLEIVNALKKNNNTVAFLGDGINDALALRSSDCGVSVEGATQMAQDAADLILLEKNLNAITKAIIRGRITHANTIKYIKMAASSNFGNVFSVLIASAWLPFQPMTATQILTQNLLYDFSQIAIPWDNVDQEFLVHPHAWSAKGIFKFMVFFGPLSSVFDVYTFMVMYFFFKWQAGSSDPVVAALEITKFQTGWFYEGLITQTLIVHMIRTQKIPFIQRWPSWQLFLGTFLCIVIGIIIPYTPLGQDVLGMSELPGLYFAFLLLAVTGYFCITQVMKQLYMYLFKEWL